MAERIAEIRPVVLARYPWHEWTDGSAWLATRGVDFHVAPKSFVSMMLGYARRKGLRVATRRPNDDEDDPHAKVEFQFLIYPRPDWTDGRVWIVKQGVDFNCSAESLVQQFEQHALEHDLQLEAEIEHHKRHPSSVKFRFVSP